MNEIFLFNIKSVSRRLNEIYQILNNLATMKTGLEYVVETINNLQDADVLTETYNIMSLEHKIEDQASEMFDVITEYEYTLSNLVVACIREMKKFLTTWTRSRIPNSTVTRFRTRCSLEFKRHIIYVKLFLDKKIIGSVCMHEDYIDITSFVEDYKILKLFDIEIEDYPWRM